MPKISRSSRWLVIVAALITLALTAGTVLGVSCASEEAGSQEETVPQADTETDSPVIVTNWAGSPEQIIADVTPQEASAILENAILEDINIIGQELRNFHVIDIRSFNECEATGVIATEMILVDYAFYRTPEQFKIRVDYLDRSRTYLIYGQTGSEEALAIMEDLGFREVYNILGGFESWIAEGLPTALVGDCGVGTNG